MQLEEGEPPAGPWAVAPVTAVVDALRAVADPVRGRPVLVAIDGRSSSGKSTLVDRLAAAWPGSAVVHTDDVAWHHAAFAWQDALVEGVLVPLRRGEAVAYRPPGWVARARSGAVEVPAGCAVVLVEGDGASRRALAGWFDAVVFVQSDREVVEARNAARQDAGEMSADSYASWMAEEYPFFRADRPWERADVVVTGTPAQALPTGPAPAAGELVVCWSPPGRSVHLLETTYAAVTATVAALGVDGFAAATRTEWTVAELLLHLLLDAQRALIAMASPTNAEPDVDAASYWRPFVPGSDPAAEADHLRWVRQSAAAYPSPHEIRRQWEVTSAAAVRAVREGVYAGRRVTTQGHVLTADDFAATLMTEGCVHLLDLTAEITGEPTPPRVLAATRAVLERILGGPLPREWDDVAAVLKGTGREPLTDADRTALRADADRLPLLG